MSLCLRSPGLYPIYHLGGPYVGISYVGISICWSRCRLGGCAITFATSQPSFSSNTWTSLGRMVSWRCWVNLKNGRFNPRIDGNLHGERAVSNMKGGGTLFSDKSVVRFATVKLRSTYLKSDPDSQTFWCQRLLFWLNMDPRWGPMFNSWVVSCHMQPWWGPECDRLSGFAWYDYTLVDTDVAINAMMWQMGHPLSVDAEVV